MKKRILKDLLKEKDFVLGTFQQVTYPEITEYLAHTGVDYIILDLEHTGHTVESVNPCLLAAAAHDIPMLVRVWEKEQCLIEQVLDAGAQGVVVPTVETVEDCEMIVRAARYAPEGTRGWCHIPPVKRWMALENDPYGDDFDPATFCKESNRTIFTVALIETPLGIKNLPEMLKVEGIDAFHLGSGDLSVRMGRTLWDPEVAQIVADATKLILDAGKICIPLATSANIEKQIQGGARMFTLAMNERAAMQASLRAEVNAIRSAAAK